MEGKPFAVSVVGYSGWFFFKFYAEAVEFMELCAEDGCSSSCYMRNELGQYEWIESRKAEEEVNI